ncbi:hypothetical protein BDV25DRAFT_38650 [Aspergillus avenaceus]|uniref:Hydrophobin n=1 Tax=Aspergillus avenaceus TaxID=36643 RepID=A0A5N6U459_ASPAV|nr:hypothetical protein BDV25DRAFT_38650 [Aspergillus avenaceus]
MKFFAVAALFAASAMAHPGSAAPQQVQQLANSCPTENHYCCQSKVSDAELSDGDNGLLNGLLKNVNLLPGLLGGHYGGCDNTIGLLGGECKNIAACCAGAGAGAQQEGLVNVGIPCLAVPIGLLN